MKNRVVKCESIQIPFKAKFVHNSAIRKETETIIVQVSNQDGLSGLGEACPRSYVTNETIQSAHNFIAQMEVAIKAIYTLDDLVNFKNSHRPEIDKNPSAWCALEMAMLDLLAREKSTSVDKLLKLTKTPSHSPSTAVLGIDTFGKFFLKLTLYKILGFKDFKIKLSGDQDEDLKRVKLTARFSSKIRVDTNNLFKNAQEAITYLFPFKDLIWAVEEPVLVNDYDQMKDIALALKIKIILDESFLNEQSLENMKAMKEYFIPNLRISKQGGVLRTLELIAKLEQENISWILGSHVGEMSLLTRVGLLISDHCSQKMLAHEGGFSTFLLNYDPFFPNLKIGFDAKIKGRKNIQSVGWGMSYSNIKERK